MKSRTSFFDKTVLRKDITRFAPLWVLYLIGGVLLALTVAAATGQGYQTSQLMSGLVGPFGIISLCYAILVAQLLFGDLFSTRLCNALHAMPLRREGWFFTHVTAGILFSLVPNAMISIVLMPYAGWFWYTALLWLLGMELHYIFFFGLAVFCMMLTGNRFAATAVYGIINFFSMIAMWFATTVFGPVMYGVVIRQEVFAPFSPVVKLAMQDSFFLVEHDPECLCRTDPYFYKYEQRGEHAYLFGGLTDSWGYVVILAVLGIALGAAALLLYRKRHLEYAGDFMAFKSVKPVFTVVYTLCAGACLQLVGNLFSDPVYVFMVIGLIVGYFTSQMLLSRTLKVFKPKNWLCAALLLALVFGSIGLCSIDAFGFVRWTPNAGNVVEVKVADSRIDTFTEHNTDAAFTDAESIRKLIAIHKLLAAEGDPKDRDTDDITRYVTLCYTLKDGREVYRQYKADYSGDAFNALKTLVFCNPKYVLRAESLEELCSKVEKVRLEDTGFTGETAREFLAAMWADAEAGTIARDYIDKPSVGNYLVTVCLTFKDGLNVYYDIHDSNVNTAKLIKEKLLEDISGIDLLKNILSFEIQGVTLGWEQEKYLKQFCPLFSEALQYGLLEEGMDGTGYVVQVQLYNGAMIAYTVPEDAKECFNWISTYLKSR